MIRVAEILPAGSWEGAPAESIVLDREDRFRRRAVLNADDGTKILLDLPKATHLHHGDGLRLEDGRIVAILAAAEELVEIEAENMDALMRIAWHLGNRHLPTQLMQGALRIRRDHVIEDMVARLGGRISPLSAPFDPEGGAYGHGAVHGHGHGHDHAHHPPHDGADRHD